MWQTDRKPQETSRAEEAPSRGSVTWGFGKVAVFLAAAARLEKNDTFVVFPNGPRAIEIRQGSGGAFQVPVEFGEDFFALGLVFAVV